MNHDVLVPIWPGEFRTWVVLCKACTDREIGLAAPYYETTNDDDERTLMQDANDQLRTYHVGTRLEPEEARALEVAQCARHAVMDAAAMCARAGLIGEEIQGYLMESHDAMCRAIDVIQGKK